MAQPLDWKYRGRHWYTGCASWALLWINSADRGVTAQKTFVRFMHSGTVTVAWQNLYNIIADITYDPFVPQEQAANGGELLAHYQAPLLDGSDAYMEVETGTYDPNDPSTRIWKN